MARYFYALYYFRKAVKLRPTDARMWCSLATCYLKLDRRDEAIRAFERAASAGGQEGRLAALELGIWQHLTPPHSLITMNEK